MSEYQRNVIIECCCKIIKFYSDNGDFLESALNSYSINGVSMQFSANANICVSNGCILPSNVYNLKEKIQSIFEDIGVNRFISKIESAIKSIDFHSVYNNAKSIFENLIDIATTSFDDIKNVCQSYMGYIGSIISSKIRLISKAFKVSLGGIALWLDNDKANVKQYINDITSDLSVGFDNLSIYLQVLQQKF